MTREIAYILLATAAASSCWLVLLLAWHELSGRSNGRRYRANVSAARLAIRQEQASSDRILLAELDRRFGKKPPGTRAGSVTVELNVDTTRFNEQIRAVRQQIERDGQKIKRDAEALTRSISRAMPPKDIG